MEARETVKRIGRAAVFHGDDLVTDSATISRGPCNRA